MSPLLCRFSVWMSLQLRACCQMVSRQCSMSPLCVILLCGCPYSYALVVKWFHDGASRNPFVSSCIPCSLLFGVRSLVLCRAATSISTAETGSKPLASSGNTLLRRPTQRCQERRHQSVGRWCRCHILALHGHKVILASTLPASPLPSFGLS